MNTKPEEASLLRLRHLAEALGPERRTRVIDIGANPLGPTPYNQLLKLDLCDVWGFEPQQDAYDKLVGAAGPREHYVPHAVGDGTRGKLRVCRGSGLTSMLEPNLAAVEYLGHFRRQFRLVEYVELETQQLDDLDLQQADLLKIDIQGGECAVFQSGRKMLEGGVAVITEVAAIPLYEGQPLLDEQMRVLSESGYNLHKFLFFKQRRLNRKYADRLRRRMASQLIDGDAVFVRNLLELESQETEWLKHLALLADGAFQSFDLVVLVLHTLRERDVVPESYIEHYVSAFAGSEQP